jgi:hypothetical protein
MVRFASGKPATDIPVVWHADAGDVSADTTFTGPDGQASVVWTLGTRAGDQTLRAHTPELPDTLVFTADARAGRPNKARHRKGGLSATVSLSLRDTVEIQVFDEFDNPVPDVQVDWSIQGGHSTLPNGAQTFQSWTDAEGIARLDWSGFDTKVSLHRLRVTIAGTDVKLDIEKQTKPDKLKKLHVSPRSATLHSIDEEFEFSADATDQFDNPVDADTVVWQAEFGDTASVVGQGKHRGRVKARGAGRTRIHVTASAGDVVVTDSVVLDVEPVSTTPVSVTGPESVEVGSSTTLQAHGTDARGHDIRKWTWEITGGGDHVEIRKMHHEELELKGISAGVVTVRATDPGGGSASFVLTVL